MINRYFKLPDAADESVFFFGARQTGKTKTVRRNTFKRELPEIIH